MTEDTKFPFIFGHVANSDAIGKASGAYNAGRSDGILLSIDLYKSGTKRQAVVSVGDVNKSILRSHHQFAACLILAKLAESLRKENPGTLKDAFTYRLESPSYMQDPNRGYDIDSEAYNNPVDTLAGLLQKKRNRIRLIIDIPDSYTDNQFQDMLDKKLNEIHADKNVQENILIGSNMRYRRNNSDLSKAEALKYLAEETSFWFSVINAVGKDGSQGIVTPLKLEDAIPEKFIPSHPVAERFRKFQRNKENRELADAMLQETIRSRLADAMFIHFHHDPQKPLTDEELQRRKVRCTEEMAGDMFDLITDEIKKAIDATQKTPPRNR